MVRLTPELVARSPQVLNCCGDRELDLRGNQIPAVENLATCRDQFDVIDLTGNTISILAGFPHLARVKVRGRINADTTEHFQLSRRRKLSLYIRVGSLR